MSKSSYIYVSYIRTTPEKVWDALTQPEFQKIYWGGTYQVTDWKPGSAWQMKFSDGRVADQGEVIEAERPKRIVLKWRNEFRPELKEEGWSRCVMDIEPQGEMTKLTITHSIDRDDSKFIVAVSGGWPKILSSMKSYLETGKPLPDGK